MLETHNREREWVVKLLQPRWRLSRRPMLPADVRDGLTDVMFSREGLLEDVNYSKIVPNHYIVELNAESYAANYQPIEREVVQQWSERLLSHLMTTNSRYGRKEYRFGGRVLVEIRPVSDVTAGQARVLLRVDPGVSGQAPVSQPLSACLEPLAGGQKIALRQGVLTLGRDAACDIVLDAPAVRERRLVSGLHAHLRVEGGTVTLYDGAPAGRASLNGSYVNRKRVGPGGWRLRDGDEIILAALDAAEPRPDIPGVAAFIFHPDCK